MLSTPWNDTVGGWRPLDEAEPGSHPRDADMRRQPIALRPGQRVWLDFVDVTGNHHPGAARVVAMDGQGISLRLEGPGAADFTPLAGGEMSLWRGVGQDVEVAMVQVIGLRLTGQPLLVTTWPAAASEQRGARRFFRVQTQLPAEGDAPYRWRGAVTDLSIGGCLVALRQGQPPPRRQPFSFHVQFPGSLEPTQLAGRTVRTSGGLFGVAFADITRRQRQQILAHVLERLKASSGLRDPAAG